MAQTNKDPMKDTLILLQGYYSYFLLGLYVDILMKKGEVPLPDQRNWKKKKWEKPQELILQVSKTNAIKLNTTRITALLEQIRKHPEGRNVYGHLWFISSLKGLLGTFLDMNARYPTRRKFLKQTLGNEYEDYMQIVRFCRNLITHQYSADVSISTRDKQLALEKLTETGKRIVSVSFSYKDIFGKEWTGSAAYWFHISINTAALRGKNTLFAIVDEHSLFMLAESIYNITNYYLKK